MRATASGGREGGLLGGRTPDVRAMPDVCAMPAAGMAPESHPARTSRTNCSVGRGSASEARPGLPRRRVALGTLEEREPWTKSIAERVDGTAVSVRVPSLGAQLLDGR